MNRRPVVEPELVFHSTRESFMRATSHRSGFESSPPIPEGIGAAEAREGLRIAYGGDAREDMRDPLLATDAEIRACGRLIAREVTQ